MFDPKQASCQCDVLTDIIMMSVERGDWMNDGGAQINFLFWLEIFTIVV